VAGYNLYRTTDASLPKERWTKLNNNLLTRNTYQDEAVEPGKKYSYYLTAVDAAGNTSQPSEVVSETVP
jgi:fibronectin type 3 domain-containing protein